MVKVLTTVPTSKQKRNETVTRDDPVVDGLIDDGDIVWGSLVRTYVSREGDMSW